MAFVSCPSCGERGKIPSSLIGSRIKCKKCGVSFTVSPPAAKAAGSASAATAAAVFEGIEVEGLDPSSWTLSTETTGGLKAEAQAEGEPRPESASFGQAEPASAPKEYKLLTPRDKIFDNRFDLSRLEEGAQSLGPPGLGRQSHAHASYQRLQRRSRRDDCGLARAMNNGSGS